MENKPKWRARRSSIGRLPLSLLGLIFGAHIVRAQVPTPAPVWLFLGEAWAQTPIPGAPLPYIPPPLSVWNQGSSSTSSPPGSGGTGGCTTIPGTNIGVGAACFSSFVGTCPALTNAHDPINFGADKTGASDSSSAIQSALSAGTDIIFGTPGTYKVNSAIDNSVAGGIQPAANVKIECAPGVTIRTDQQDPHDSGIFAMTNGGNTICGCDFQGANTGSSPKKITTSSAYLLLIFGGSNYTIEDNTFENTSADAAVNVTDNPVSNVTFTYNTCNSNPFYCFVLNQTITGATVSHNLVVDGTLGVEFDACGTGTVGTALNFTANEVQAQLGTCNQISGGGNCNGDGVTGPGFIPVGSGASACNYSGVTFNGTNYCQGTSTLQAWFGSKTNGSVTGANAANISGNSIGANCTCSNAGGC